MIAWLFVDVTWAQSSTTSPSAWVLVTVILSHCHCVSDGVTVRLSDSHSVPVWQCHTVSVCRLTLI